jgi:hypothetical protein
VLVGVVPHLRVRGPRQAHVRDVLGGDALRG